MMVSPRKGVVTVYALFLLGLFASMVAFAGVTFNRSVDRAFREQTETQLRVLLRHGADTALADLRRNTPINPHAIALPGPLADGGFTLTLSPAPQPSPDKITVTISATSPSVSVSQVLTFAKANNLWQPVETQLQPLTH